MVDQPTNVDEATEEGLPVHNPANINQPENIDPDALTPPPVFGEEKKTSQVNEDKAIAVFAKRTGYKKDDVIAYNRRGTSHIFVTANGGKYELRGDRVRTLQGPEPPKES